MREEMSEVGRVRVFLHGESAHEMTATRWLVENGNLTIWRGQVVCADYAAGCWSGIVRTPEVAA